MVNDKGTNSMAKYRKQIQLAVFLLLLTGCSTTMSNNDTKFDWKATESGPEKYLMQIIDGAFRYHGDPGGDGLYVPSGAALYEGWGIMRSSHNVGPDLKPLPDKLDITYFSFAENKFYQGSFDLPYENILSLFRKGVADNKGEPTDFRIMVGVAPGGSVAVWVMNEGVKEVFFGKAQKIESELRAFGRVIPNRDEYAIREIKDTVGPEVLTDIQKNGIPFDQWARFRTQYHWKLTFTVTHPPQSFGMNFYNGESSRFSFPYEHDFTITTHPIPDKIQFSYAINGQGKKYLYIIHFDEAEMFEAFDRLGGDQQPLQLEIDPKVPKKSTQIRLRNEKEEITLKKYSIEEF